MDPPQLKGDDYHKFKDLYESMIMGEREKVIERISEFAAISQDPWRNLTVCNDTVLHMAIYMKHENIAKEILEYYADPFTLQEKNVFGDTVLHEAAATNMIGLVKVLIEREPRLLLEPNENDETPLFRAAHFGQTAIFIFLCDEMDKTFEGKPPGDEKLKHLRRKDKKTVLHIAILAEFFDLALEIAMRYPDLVNLENENKLIGLHLLSSKPSAFKSGCNHALLKSFLYYCVPSEVEDQKVKLQGSCLPPNYAVFEDLYIMIKRRVTSGLRKLNLSIWNLFRQGWPVMEKIWNEKRMHESALKLAKLLIKEDISWELSSIQEDKAKISLGHQPTRDEEKLQEDEDIEGRIPQLAELEEPRKQTKKNGNPSKSQKHLTKTSTSISSEARAKAKDKEATPPPTSLLIATRNGIVEIVKEILAVYPQAVAHISDMGQNILHVAIKHRKKEIFSLVKRMEIPMTRLVRRIDNNENTILHHVAVMQYYTGGTLPGPALQLQEELHWFERVQKIIPPHYAMHRNKKDKTAKEFFESTHARLLKEAQEWLKRTSESCSTVAVLIATVAFAAAYTVPGGSNQDTGLPILLHDPFFLVFTVMDVLSLASSLTSVVMFLSILTSPFQLQDFRHSLPRKLTLGFTFLFFSVAVTMLAFAATILLIIHLKKRWTTLLLYFVAFFPVTIFALLQFPLYLAFTGTLKRSFRVIKKVFPWHFIPRLFKTTASSIGKAN